MATGLPWMKNNPKEREALSVGSPTQAHLCPATLLFSAHVSWESLQRTAFRFYKIKNINLLEAQ